MKKSILSFAIAILIAIGINCPAVNAQFTAPEGLNDQITLPCCNQDTVHDMEMDCCVQNDYHQRFSVMNPYQDNKLKRVKGVFSSYKLGHVTRADVVYQMWQPQKNPPRSARISIQRVVRLE